MNSQILTVLFADLADSTRLYQTRGDVSAHRTVSQSLQCMRDAIEANQGKLLRTVGDASLASFENADTACMAAVQIQREHETLGARVRVGFHCGEVILDDGDVYGNAVNLAARVAAYAEANEICTTQQALVELSFRHRANTHFLDSVDFKGIEKPLPVYRVNWKFDAAQTVVVSSNPESRVHLEAKMLTLTMGEQQVQLDSGNPAIAVGRASSNDIVIQSDSASRNHASIKYVRGRFVLSDTSTNGTFLVGEDDELELLKRDSAYLEQRGAIGLGIDPREQAKHAIKYRLKTTLE